MINITIYPYFLFDEIMESLFQSIRSEADIKFINFDRVFADRCKFLMIPNRKQTHESFQHISRLMCVVICKYSKNQLSFRVNLA